MRPIVKAVGLICILTHDYLIVKMKMLFEYSVTITPYSYELANCAVKVQTQEELDNHQTEEMTENEEQDEEAELSPLPSLS